MSAPESSGPIRPGCPRCLEIDVAQFLEHAAEPQWRDFREHYPRCPDCAAEVRAWTEVHAALSADVSAHPDPELLWRFESRSAELSADQRGAVERHLRACPSCRDELAALARFDPAKRREPAKGLPGGLGSALAGWLERLRSLVWHPAFAYALVLLLVLPMVGRLREEAGRHGRRAAEQEAPESRSHRSAPPAPAAKEAVGKAPPVLPPADRAAEPRLELDARPSANELAAPAQRQSRAQPPSADRLAEKRKAFPAEGGVTAGSTAGPVSSAGEGKGGAGQEAVAAPAAPPWVSKDESNAGRAAARRRSEAEAAVIDASVTGTIPQAMRGGASEVVIRLARPPGMPADAAGWVRLRTADGTRELREPIAPGQSIELRVPTAWLRSGSYLFQVGREPQGVIDSRTLAVE